MARSAFGRRFKEVFGNATNKEIAVKIGVSAPAVQNYADGRVPPAEMLVTISSVTGCDLHWLLTGERKEVLKAVDPLINEAALRTMIREVLRDEMRVQELGPVDEFDLDAAIGAGMDDVEIIDGWYRHEGRKPPADFLGMLARTEGPVTPRLRREMLTEMKMLLDGAIAGNQKDER